MYFSEYRTSITVVNISIRHVWEILHPAGYPALYLDGYCASRAVPNNVDLASLYYPKRFDWPTIISLTRTRGKLSCTCSRNWHLSHRTYLNELPCPMAREKLGKNATKVAESGEVHTRYFMRYGQEASLTPCRVWIWIQIYVGFVLILSS